jgi:hypothetical protein
MPRTGKQAEAPTGTSDATTVASSPTANNGVVASTRASVEVSSGALSSSGPQPSVPVQTAAPSVAGPPLKRRRAPLGGGVAASSNGDSVNTQSNRQMDALEFILLHQEPGNILHATTSGGDLAKGALFWLAVYMKNKKKESETRQVNAVASEFGPDALLFGRLPTGSPCPNRPTIRAANMDADEFMERFIAATDMTKDENGAVLRVGEGDFFGFDPSKNWVKFLNIDDGE